FAASRTGAIGLAGVRRPGSSTHRSRGRPAAASDDVFGSSSVAAARASARFRGSPSASVNSLCR
ncbi:hypothetical protein, partial [Streptomyces sp. SID685]|uniref:hypothetical protein n=1 Tax=Streptomyces sp. SID685 TaxID=2690322 RepID=UPI001F23589C